MFSAVWILNYSTADQWNAEPANAEKTRVQETESKMQMKVILVVLCAFSTGAALSGCATGNASERQPTLHEQCLAEATSKNARSECTVDNQKRMQGGRGFGSW